jgi:hypothetical protein
MDHGLLGTLEFGLIFGFGFWIASAVVTTIVSALQRMRAPKA